MNEWLMKLLGNNRNEIATSIYSSLKLGGGVALSLVTNIALIPVLLFYFLMDWPSMIARINEWTPIKFRDPIRDFSEELSNSLGQYLRGQLLVMLCLAVLYSVGLQLIGLKLGVPIGVFTGIAVCIPYVGYASGLILAFLCAWLQSPMCGSDVYIGIACVYALGQVIEGFYLTPKLVGSRVGLNPVSVIFSLLAFGHLFGFIGVLLALPLSAIILVACRRMKRLYFASKLYHD
jgi:predicted PurR-regulated permease PerM